MITKVIERGKESKVWEQGSIGPRTSGSENMYGS